MSIFASFAELNLDAGWGSNFCPLYILSIYEITVRLKLRVCRGSAELHLGFHEFRSWCLGLPNDGMM